MIKKIVYILIPTCMTLSVAVAEPLSSNPVLLSSDQMDQITAGLSSTVTADAMGNSTVFALTQTSTTANVYRTGNGGNTGLVGGGAISGGQAVAGAAGNGASTGTSVTPHTDITGPNSQSIQLSNNTPNNTPGSLVNLSTGAIVSVSLPATNPF